jgi:hypothetical protein
VQNQNEEKPGEITRSEAMKLGIRFVAILIGLLLVPAGLRSQEQNKAATAAGPEHLRVDLLLTEYNGETKISSLPYTLYVAVGTPHESQMQSSVRLGVKVPMPSAPESQGHPNTFNYQNVGTDIDCRAHTAGEGLYDMNIWVSRSSVYTSGEAGYSGDQLAHVERAIPVLRDFSSSFDVSLHDGQSIDGLSATDPLSGHILKINVTVHLEK